MTQDKLDVLADSCWEDHNGLNTFNHVKFASLVAAHEREACACTCEAYALESMEAFNRTGHDFEDGQVNGGYGCAAAIRARGEK